MSSLVPTSGVMRGRVHVFPVRVYYEDTDAGGVVYYANYLKFAERGRTELLRTLEIEQQRLHAETGMLFVVHQGEVKYRTPARLDDALTVETALVELGAASVTMRQEIKRGNDDIASLTAQVACVSSEGKPMRMPVQLRRTLEQYVSDNGVG